MPICPRAQSPVLCTTKSTNPTVRDNKNIETAHAPHAARYAHRMNANVTGVACVAYFFRCALVRVGRVAVVTSTNIK